MKGYSFQCNKLYWSKLPTQHGCWRTVFVFISSK